MFSNLLFIFLDLVPERIKLVIFKFCGNKCGDDLSPVDQLGLLDK